ncbi:MAG: aminomethyl-transferring glycine dehydrogenase [Candidatus Poribacteria bacterium]|nr:aminomethyl-transferring glycine dehydrogenase [Candidatus Poribacteria bacterium]MDE0506398.1 aminomethyl-transferring glycine dehydrogenase [Candidatus Poribacteria bacterium]
MDSTREKAARALDFTDRFVNRHIGPQPGDIEQMLEKVGYDSLQTFIEDIIPSDIRLNQPLNIGPGYTEHEALRLLSDIASRNEVYRSFIGMGYYNCILPPVIQRNILENPGWYTAYTPYQAEISQGRLEALLNFQTMIIDLCGLPVANASLLDEATAAAEAMGMCLAATKHRKTPAFFISETCHPQTIAVLQTRAESMGIELVLDDHRNAQFHQPIVGAIVQYPASDGVIHDYRGFAEQVHEAGGLLITATDLLALTLILPPGEFGADIAIGSAQRFGVPMGYGGPHAAFLATKEKFKRSVPGRIAGLSQDTEGVPAIRLALQTREQHIRREKATSNICTAQVLLAVMASMYAVYHGPVGLRRIAKRVHKLTAILRRGLESLQYKICNGVFFDTISVDLGSANLDRLLDAARGMKMNLRVFDRSRVGMSLDEATTAKDVQDLLEIFALGGRQAAKFESLTLDGAVSNTEIPTRLQRTTQYLSHPVFNSYHSETEMSRYIHKLQAKDLSLIHSMIPLGSCTMKLNATTEMIPVSWDEFSQIHPFAPRKQTIGYQTLFSQLESWLSEITGFAGVSLQPNAGSQGEYTGLLVIRKYHRSRGEGHRNVCLVPRSAHGTNPASAVMAGMKVVAIDCDDAGNIHLFDLRRKSEEHSRNLAASMITYPSTHGVFEEGIRQICDIVHQHGGQVYMDGANMNAMVGLCRPGDFGPDVCHLNLHKTFCIPHGGGGPGMGPIGVKEHLTRFLPTHPLVCVGGEDGVGAISGAPWGSPSILPISWAYIAMMGNEGLKRASEVAILNANYVAKCLEPHYSVLYKGSHGLVAHECIVDLRGVKSATGVGVADIAKRLMDYGFHAPTVSWPVNETMMIEPTESESKQELDRFCEALISIRQEIAEIENGQADRSDNVLKNAPHTAFHVTQSEWTHGYSREKAAFPASWTHGSKYWPPVSRVDEVHGDRTLICACPPIDSYGS